MPVNTPFHVLEPIEARKVGQIELRDVARRSENGDKAELFCASLESTTGCRM